MFEFEPFSFTWYSLFFAGFLVVLLASIIVSKLIQKLAQRYQIIDSAALDPQKKKHKGSVPLLVGSGAVVVALAGMLVPTWLSSAEILNFENFTKVFGWESSVYFFAVSTIILLIGGFLDDKFHLHPTWQFVFVFAALGVFLISGVRLDIATFGGGLEWLNIVLTGAWLLLCMAATKFLDGHDGLVTTVGIIGFGGIASIALFDRIQEPLFALFALTWMIALLGFLPFNFPKARVYLGEGASLAIGFAIGYFSLVLNSKLVVSNGVIGLFVIDLILVWFLRYRQGRNFFTSGDRLHWHHRLARAGLDKLQILVLTAIILLVNVHVSIYLASKEQYLLTLVQLVGFVLVLATLATVLKKRRS